MKQLIRSVVFVLFVFSFFASALAQRLEVNKYGEVRVAQNAKWRALTPAEKKAYDNPGREIPTGDYSLMVERLDFFHIKADTQYNKVVVFADGKLQTKDRQVVIQGNIEFSWHVVLLLMSIVFMVISNIVFMYNHNSASYSFVSMALLFAFFSLVMGLDNITFVVFAALGFLVAIVAGHSIENKNVKLYTLFSLLYYLATVTALFV